MLNKYQISLKKLKPLFCSLTISFYLLTPLAQAQKPGWAVVPPMGWNSWNCFGPNVNEKQIIGIADAMVSSGMKDAGYQYVVIDDGWQLGRKKSPNNKDLETSGRDAQGKILANPEIFPRGIKYVADYVHSKGLKFGLYTAPGVSSCGGFTGSVGFEENDVNTFAEWGVDYIKLDWCGCTENDTIVLQRWRKLLNKASRPIVLSVNTGNLGDWLPKYADMWRTSSDIMSIWASDLKKFKIFPGISDIFEINSYSPIKQVPSSWNDADMLQICNGNLTLEENKSHFSVWAIFGAPLMAGTDLRNMTPECAAILTNKEIIAVNQDAAGIQGIMMKGEKQGQQLWVKKLSYYSDYAVLLLNISDTASMMKFDAADLKLKGPVFLRDLWNHADLGLFEKPYETLVPAHGAVMLKVTANEYPVKLPESNIPVLPINQKIEVENSFLSFEAGYICDSIQGFSDKGYLQGVNHDWCVFYILWKYIVDKEGLYKIKFQYQNPTKTNSNFTLNGVPIVFASTPKNKWATVEVEIPYQKGIQSIALRSTSVLQNGIAIDYFTISKK